MLLKKYNSIMQKPEHHRNKWAFGLAVTFSVFIFFGWALFNGYVSFGGDKTLATPKTNGQLASVVSAKEVSSPIENAKETFKGVFGEINKQYNKFKESVSDVFIPFITGIEVYERQ